MSAEHGPIGSRLYQRFVDVGYRVRSGVLLVGAVALPELGLVSPMVGASKLIEIYQIDDPLKAATIGAAVLGGVGGMLVGVLGTAIADPDRLMDGVFFGKTPEMRQKSKVVSAPGRSDDNSGGSANFDISDLPPFGPDNFSPIPRRPLPSSFGEGAVAEAERILAEPILAIASRNP